LLIFVLWHREHHRNPREPAERRASLRVVRGGASAVSS
jgi:hypothetical protein